MSSPGKVRLTYLITGLQYGGANIGMVRLLSGLDHSEFDITIISIVDTSNNIVSLLPDYITVRKLDIASISDTYRAAKVILPLRRSDVVVCSLFHASILGVPIGRLLNIPQVLIWQHSTGYKSSFRQSIYNLLYRISDHVLADSQSVAQMLSDDFGIENAKISQLPIAGIDTDLFSPHDSPDTNRENVITVGTIARLTEEKGLFDLLKCAETLGPEFQFKVIGQGEQRDLLEQRAPNNVEFIGLVDSKDIPSRLASFDIYFQPSKYEGLCMTVIEAMSCGLPVVASEVGGIPESVVPETTGYLCEPGEIDCFTTSLDKLGADPELRQRMGSAGRERVIDKYSRSVLVEKFEEVVARTT